ncbi:MAG: hypothetical protein K6U10_01375 [Acidobacteriia bacterium]|nr:hypothetical protein [Methyloceanibacter sp.]MCL6490452.1 hypothetical protein [Terriglobia bacterium]
MRNLEKKLRDNRQRSREIQQQIKERQSKLCQDLLPGKVSIGWAAERVGVWVFQNLSRSEEARNCYIEQAASRTLELPKDLHLDPWPPAWLHADWLALAADFELLTPWYSKDDRPFHVLDNPVRKDRVFGVPFMSAASWKGLLRWACRMHAGLHAHLRDYGGSLEGWKDPVWILHLFGNEKTEDKGFHQGALAFRPTWFSKIGFEVINPHKRKTRAGKQPIFYEVVPAGTSGQLQFLYAPLPGAADRDKVKPSKALGKLVDATQTLLTTYGISAKRTAGWGTAKIKTWKAWRHDTPCGEPLVGNSRGELLAKLSPARGAGP